jgi:hypothetical protein
VWWWFDIAHVRSTSTPHRTAASIRQYVNALFVAGSGRKQELPLRAPMCDHVELTWKHLTRTHVASASKNAASLLQRLPAYLQRPASDIRPGSRAVRDPDDLGKKRFPDATEINP